MVLTHLEELFKVQSAVVIRVGVLEYCRGESFREVLALIFLNHLRQLPNFQVSIAVSVVLKTEESHSSTRFDTRHSSESWRFRFRVRAC